MFNHGTNPATNESWWKHKFELTAGRAAQVGSGMPAHSIPLATASALFEEERARMRQAWRDYTESLFEDARNRLYVESPMSSIGSSEALVPTRAAAT